MKYILILTLLLTGCSGGGGKSAKSVTVIQTEQHQCRSAFYGDSIGKQLRDSVYAPDFDYYVEGGRTIMGVDSLDDGYCTIYLELGTNIAAEGAEAEEMQLIGLIAGIEDKVVCVLPMSQMGVFWHMRDMMKEHCKRIIDPVQHGVYPLSFDGVHLQFGTDNDNLKHYASLFTDQYQ